MMVSHVLFFPVPLCRSEWTGHDLLSKLRPLLAEYVLDPGKCRPVVAIDVSMLGDELGLQGVVVALYLVAPGVNTFHCLVIDTASVARGLVRGVSDVCRFKMGVANLVAWSFEQLTGAFLFLVPRFAGGLVRQLGPIERPASLLQLAAGLFLRGPYVAVHAVVLRLHIGADRGVGLVPFVRLALNLAHGCSAPCLQLGLRLRNLSVALHRRGDFLAGLRVRCCLLALRNL